MLIKNGTAIPLSKTEVKLIELFIKNRNQVLTWEVLLERIWDIDGNFVEDNTLTVYVKRLREKLGEAIKIETVRGMGYRVG